MPRGMIADLRKWVYRIRPIDLSCTSQFPLKSSFQHLEEKGGDPVDYLLGVIPSPFIDVQHLIVEPII